jgi:hypothetical protein
VGDGWWLVSTPSATPPTYAFKLIVHCEFLSLTLERVDAGVSQNRAIFTSVSSPVPASEEQIFAACEQALRLAPAEYPPTLPSSKELLGAPEWYSFEVEAWPIGESIRQSFVANPTLKRKDAVLARVAEVATCRNLRRGRQSFIGALGFVAAQRYAGALAPFLSDRDVYGQVFDTLIKMKAFGFSCEAASLLHSDKTWIRCLAKKYVERCSLARTP